MQIMCCYYVNGNIAAKEGAGWPFEYSKLNKLIILGGINQPVVIKCQEA